MYPSETFKYQYLAGPVVTEAELLVPPKIGNCRFALQWYFYKIHQLFLKQDEIYLPGGYKTMGKFIVEEATVDFTALETGDVIYAQNIKNKKGELMAREKENYATKDDWLFHLHSAVFIGAVTGNTELYVWHATSIENGTAVWPVEKFCEYYLPVSVKRVV